MTTLSPASWHTGPRVRLARRGLLLSCAAAAMLSAAPSRTNAQAFRGTPQFDPNAVNIDRSQPGRDTITLRAPSVTINWTPTDNQGTGVIDFLPSGTTALFQNDPQLPNFTVLNLSLIHI